MATVTGTLKDFGLESLLSFNPEIEFVISGPTLAGDILVPTKRRSVVPQSNDVFAIDLAPTDSMRPARWYTITIRWLNSTGVPVGADFPEWRLFVPPEGGALSDLLAVPTNPAMVWVGPPDPGDPSRPLGLNNPTPGTWWLNTSTGDLLEWSN